MAYCLTAPNHYIKILLVRFCDIHLWSAWQTNAQATILNNIYENCSFKMIATSYRGAMSTSVVRFSEILIKIQRCLRRYSIRSSVDCRHFLPLPMCQNNKRMMTSSNGNIFRVTGPLCGEFTGHRWIPLTKASDAELLMFSLIRTRINDWVNNRKAGNLRCHRAHYDVTVMKSKQKQQMKLALFISSHTRHDSPFPTIKF